MNEDFFAPTTFTEEQLAILIENVSAEVGPITIVNLGRRRVRIRSGNSTIAFGLSEDEDLTRLANEIIKVMKE